MQLQSWKLLLLKVQEKKHLQEIHVHYLTFDFDFGVKVMIITLGGQGHCSVPSTSSDLFRYKVYLFRRRYIYKKCDGHKHTQIDRHTLVQY